MAEDDTLTAGTPRWVKVFALIGVVVVVLVVAMLATGRGGHGPGRHAPSGQNPPSEDTGGHRPPAGGHTRP